MLVPLSLPWQWLNPVLDQPGPPRKPDRLAILGASAEPDPYDGRGVLLYYEGKVFEARWVKSTDQDADPKMKALGYPGYWLRSWGGCYPPVPCHWCRIAAAPYRDGLVEAARGLQQRNWKDRVIISRDTVRSTGWLEVEYCDGTWTDILGGTTPDGALFRGLIVYLPEENTVSEGKKVVGQAGLIWQ